MGKVVLRDYGKVANTSNWPSGEFLMDVLSKEHIFFQQKDPLYWQACARWAMLKKYKFPHLPEAKYTADTDQMVFTEAEMESIAKAWETLLQQGSNNNIDHDDGGGSNNNYGDVVEMLTSGGRSNDRPLLWTVMDCPPGLQFKLHAHPNLELIYCARGALHEVRMTGEPYTKSYETIPDENGETTKPTKVKGPNLTSLDRSWYFDTLAAGRWLVNEVGSIHKSFTATSGEGCLLVVLWGGSHADIVQGQEPAAVDVHKAVNDMDTKLGTTAYNKNNKNNCPSCGSNWETIQETFLPASERIGAVTTTTTTTSSAQ